MASLQAQRLDQSDGFGLSLAIKLGQTALLTRLLRIEDYGRVLIVLNLFIFLDSFFGLR